MKLFPGQVAQEKNLYRLRIVCACLRQIYSLFLATIEDPLLFSINDIKSFGDDPFMFASLALSIEIVF